MTRLPAILLARRNRRTHTVAQRFTFVELITIIAIVAVLAALLLPTVRRSRTQIKLSVCRAQMRQMSQALAIYVDDNAGMLFAVRSGGNPSTNQTFPFDQPEANGLANLYRCAYVTDPTVFYCPGAEPFAGAAPDPVALRHSFMQNFEEDFQQGADRRVDYDVGWWDDKWFSGRGYCQRFEDYNDWRGIWLADSWSFLTNYYRSAFHGNQQFQNVAHNDGGVSTIHFFLNQITVNSFYDPFTDRPWTEWWQKFGRELR